MLRKIVKSAEDQLIEQRRSDISRMAQGSMRSHGKLWGMDTFSWFNPDDHALNAVVMSLPFPVIWIANWQLVHRTSAENQSMANHIDALFFYNGNAFQSSTELLNSYSTCIGTNSITEAMLLTKSFQDKQRVILFSSSRVEWHEDQLEFEQFLAAAKAL